MPQTTRRFRSALIFATLALGTIPATAQQVPWSARIPTTVNPDTLRSPDMTILVPREANGFGTMFDLDTGASIPPESSALRLSNVPATSIYGIEAPFRIAVPGPHRFEVECVLVRINAFDGTGRPQLLGVGYFSAPSNTPASGTIRIGFPPLNDQIAAQEQANRRSESQVTSPVASCRMFATGNYNGLRWRTIAGSVPGIQPDRRPDPVLLENARGQAWSSQPFTTTPNLEVFFVSANAAQ